ncbi:MAG: putative transport system ATP-binding protein [Mycobacterium sp.]|jgi:putative ABC transport system ATP-binding protein|nr:putative transport system ATP-binding protein [Mycobacterium sp.]
MPPETPAIEALAVTRTYRGGGHQVRGVDQVSLTAARGEVVAVTGPSGSGKSTLLFLLAGLDIPDAGQVCVAGVDWATLRGRARARFRRQTCSFILQGLALLPAATAAENVEVPLLLDGVEPTARGRRAAGVLERVGLAQHALKLTDRLSGGQQQRVAIARALVVEPAVILADEPTGSLDSVTAEEIVRLLVAAARERDAAVVMVTHDPTVAAHADRVVTMHSGRLQ